jgi:hypothetical protein
MVPVRDPRYDAWLQTAVDWADAKYAIALAEEAEDEDRR